MKNRIFYTLITIASLVSLVSFKLNEPTTAVKCLIQLKEYQGKGAYIIVSLIRPEGNYEQTLYVQGEDDKWYHEIDQWWGYYGKYRPSLDGITGATITGGERTIKVLQIPTEKIDQGYTLRFETSVEDEDYFPTDVEIPLTTDNLSTKVKGKGFISYVRLINGQ